MKKLLPAVLLLAHSLFGGEISIAVAANVSYAIEELKVEFAKEHPDTKVRVTLSSSGKLTAQIKNGAPYGIFMSADMKFPEALYAEGIATTKPVGYAEGALAYLTTQKLDLSKGISLVNSKEVSKIAIANPKTAPYGKAALDAIKNAGVLESVQKKFVYAESISQTVAYAITAADIGFIAKASLFSPTMSMYKEGVHYRDVDPKLYTPIEQGMVMLKHAQNAQEYRDFYDFILSTKAKEIFVKYGYIVSGGRADE